MSKVRRNILLVFILGLVLLSFHPMGRVIVKFILPLGVGVMDLIGTGFLLIFLVVLFYPIIKGKFLKSQEKSKNENLVKSMSNSKDKSNKSGESQVFQNFALNLMMYDKELKFVPYYTKLFKVATDHGKLSLLDGFLEYYGELTIKFLNAKEELIKHTKSDEVDQALKNINEALDSILPIIDKFIIKILSDDLNDLNSNIKVLGLISIRDNLV